MKIRDFFLFFITLLILDVNVYGQTQINLDRKISLDLSAIELGAVLKLIEKQLQVKIAYSTESVPVKKIVTLKYNNKPLFEILDDISFRNGLKYEVSDGIIVISKNIHALERNQILGKVTDSKGEVIIGAGVLLKNTQIATITDVNGNFSIRSGDTLIFTHVGFKTKEVNIANKTEVDVVLQQYPEPLEEVVVVGYGTQKKSIITGAISSVKAQDIANQQVDRVEHALQGRTSGVAVASSSGAPGAAATLRIRGATSLNERSSDPLYVVDGVVVTAGGIDYLNPNDIESIEVLKDAASAAIYGARSAAGVILVTTKQGQSGAIRINYSAYGGVQSPAKKLNLLNASQYATLINEQAVNGGNSPIYSDPESFGIGTDWQELIFNNNASIQNHEFSLSGGSDKSVFYSSFGYFDRDGIVASKISNSNRISIRLNAAHKIAKGLTIGENVGYSRIKSKGGVYGNTDFGGPLSSAIMLDPITQAIITDPAVINKSPYSTQPVVRDDMGNPYGISDYVFQQVTNPLAYIKTQEGNYTLLDNIVGNVYVELNTLIGLKIRSTLGARLTYSAGEIFRPLYFLNPNQFTEKTSFTRNKEQSLNWNLENTISYTKQISDHNFTVLLGQGAYSDDNNSGLSVTYSNLPVNTFDEASMNYSTAPANIEAIGSEDVVHRITSWFGRVTYNYAEKYLFTGIIRRDGSTRFGPDNKFGYFPSASIGWVATSEDFLTDVEYLDFLKFRASYGITGNDVLGDFRYISTVSGGRNYTFGDHNYHIGYSPDASANPGLRWEQTSQFNLGVDGTFYRNWDLTFDWFSKRTTGILQVLEFPGYVGATGVPYGNVADMVNRGVELELGYRKKSGDFTFNMSGNVSYLENEVTYLGDGKLFLEGGATLQSSSYTITRTAVGHAIDSFFGFETLGIFQNQHEIDTYVGTDGSLIQPAAVPGDFKWADLNKDGKITADDRTFTGDPTPNWTYGLTFSASWKNFDLLLFGQGVAGNQIFQGLRRMDIPTANWQTTALGRWHGEGTSNTHPRLTTMDKNNNFANPSVFHLQDGDYFRLKTFQVGYTFSDNMIKSIGAQKIRLYLSSHNLLTLTDYTGYDPEIGGDSYGIDRAIYPQSRSFLLGVNVVF